MNVENPLVSLGYVLSFHSRDWSQDNRDAWIWGIVNGWDDSLAEVARLHGWTQKTSERLQRLHEKFKEMESEIEKK